MSGMSMGMSQQLRQQMVLAPQLRQSLEMLQLPVMELYAMIQQEMEQNPTLEVERSDKVSIEERREESELSEGLPTAAELGMSSHERSDLEPRSDAKDSEQEFDFDRELEALTQLDDEWRDYFFQDGGSQEYTTDMEEKRQFMFDSIVQTESLQQHLLGQLDLTNLDDAGREIAEMIIGSLDDSGYLITPLADIAQGALTDMETAERCLAAVQEMTPSGVGARDLRECLLIQLRHQQRQDSLAAKIVARHIDLVAGHKYAQLAGVLGVSAAAAEEAVAEIVRLDPQPGLTFSQEEAAYVVPEMEVYFDKEAERYVVRVDDDYLPHIRISGHYRRLLENPETSDETRSYIRERIRAGMFLIKSIHQRQETIRKIATEIVDVQQDFFVRGIKGLRPLTMADIAQRVGVHETTVSRTVSGKYMRTPRGVLELRFFFTPGLQTADGGSISNRTIQDRISQMVSAEDSASPLADQEIQARLEEEGIKIARRTVAKYRNQLKIPPSHQRRRG